MQHSTLTEQARHWAASQPEQVWMRDLSESGATEYTWGAAVAEIDRVAAWLEAEFGHGERMALLSRNRAHWIMADMGIIHSGNVTVPLFTTHAQATAEYILSFTDTKVLFLGETENWRSVKEVSQNNNTCACAHVRMWPILPKACSRSFDHSSLNHRACCRCARGCIPRLIH